MHETGNENETLKLWLVIHYMNDRILSAKSTNFDVLSVLELQASSIKFLRFPWKTLFH